MLDSSAALPAVPLCSAPICSAPICSAPISLARGALLGEILGVQLLLGRLELLQLLRLSLGHRIAVGERQRKAVVAEASPLGTAVVVDIRAEQVRGRDPRLGCFLCLSSSLLLALPPLLLLSSQALLFPLLQLPLQRLRIVELPPRSGGTGAAVLQPHAHFDEVAVAEHVTDAQHFLHVSRQRRRSHLLPEGGQGVQDRPQHFFS
eukprot:scaffold48_cov311-Pinguiococcus_pyrenoidosus.AAC.252